MINHVRTLILNQSASSPSGLNYGLVGSEFIPPTYQPVVLTPALQRLRDVIYGTRPDVMMLLYRTFQLMGLLHGSELSRYVTWFDTRITYLPIKTDLFDVVYGDRQLSPMRTKQSEVNTTTGEDFLSLIQLAEPYNLRVTNLTVKKVLTALPTARMAVVGAPPTESQGALVYTWMVEVLGDFIRISRIVPAPTLTVSQDYTYVGNSTGMIPVPETKLWVELQDVSLGDVFEMSYTAEPTASLAELAYEMKTSFSEDAATVLGNERIEPLRTWQRVWSKSSNTISQFAALLLAMAYRTDVLRKQKV